MAQPNLSSFTWSNRTIFGKGICKRLSVWSRKANESPLPGWKESFMDMPLWFANLVFWSVQVALLVLAAGLLAGALKLRQPRDRKSTRLNSSHLGISYAVFCLKKKILFAHPPDARYAIVAVLLASW